MVPAYQAPPKKCHTLSNKLLTFFMGIIVQIAILRDGPGNMKGSESSLVLNWHRIEDGRQVV